MSETLAKTSADGSQGGAPAPQQRRRPAWLTPVNLTIIIITLVALALRVYYQYTRPGFLLGVTEYDDGPYFGSAVRLVHGSMPYRDFVLVQPPGITLLMSPVGLLTYWTGTAWGLAIGRILTVLAGTAGVALAGLLVRHRGLLAVLLTCGIVAVYSDGVAAAHTVLVEPWLVLFCLAGAVTVFDGDRITASTKRLVWGGVLFGFGGAVEAWAIVPVLVLAVLCLPRIKRAAVFAGGVAAGFVIPVLPFAIAGPSQLYRSLITAQVGYRAHAVRVGVLLRLRNMIGLPYALGWSKSLVLLAVLALVIFVVVTQAAAIAVTQQPPPILDWFATVTTVLIVAMFLWPPQFHYHFAEFLAPFMALTLALPVSRLLGGARPDGSLARHLAAHGQREDRPPGRPGHRQRVGGGARGGGGLPVPLRERGAAGHRPDTGRDRPADPARCVCADRPGVGHPRRQPVRLHRPELPQADRQPGHHAGPVRRPETADRGGERRGGERGVEPGVQQGPVRAAHRYQHPADRVEPAA